jgi:large subunit ribosomal protein L7A
MTQIMQTIKEAKQKIIGLKQTLRAIQQDRVQTVYIADDIDEHIARQITEICRQKEISLVPANINQKEMGRLCQIEVGAAVVSLVKQE